MKSGGGGHGRQLYSAHPPEEIVELLDSIAYFQTALSQSAAMVALFAGDTTRTKKRWASIHQTIPKVVLLQESSSAASAAKKAPFSLQDLLDKVFLTTESVQKVLETADVSALSIEDGEQSDRSLAACIAFTRDVATTLANVIAACLAEQS